VYESEDHRTDEQEDAVLREAIIQEEGIIGEEAEEFDLESIDVEDDYEVGVADAEDSDYVPTEAVECEGDDDEDSEDSEDEDSEWEDEVTDGECNDAMASDEDEGEEYENS
jgi:hypothetical protein